MPQGDLKEIADGAVSPPPEFKLADLVKGKDDPRGRLVRDLFWAVSEFKIYKTDQGISPFFSDDPEMAKQQKLAYLGLGEDIADFNHLIHTLQPQTIPFTEKPIRPNAAGSKSLVHYERELARCIAQALLGQGEIAKASLADLRRRLAARISNRGRVVHLMINAMLVAVAVIGGLAFAKSGYVSIFGFNVREMGLAVMMGSIGALFSTTVRLQSMAVDPTVSQYMHWVYGAQRILVGALGALIIYYGFKSGVVNGLFQPLSGSVDVAQPFDPYWLSFVCVLAGFSERLVPNLLSAKAAAAQEAEAQT